MLLRIVTLLSLLGVAANVAGATSDRSAEYRVKAAIIEKIIDFVSWPSAEPGETQRHLCVAGEDPFGDELRAAFAQRSDVTIHSVGDVGSDLARCHIVYVSDSEQRDYRSLLDRIRNRPILTVSDIPRFASNGGMINLTFINRRVRFVINQEQAERAGVRISYKLLRLAEIVRSGYEEDRAG